MSSMIRRLEKRMMKAAGMKLFSTPVPGQQHADGSPVMVQVVADKDAEIYGNRWPSRIPRKFVAPVRGADLTARLFREQRRIAARNPQHLMEA